MADSNPMQSFGLLFLRVAFGALMMVHGIQKVMAYSTLQEVFPDPLGMGSQLSLIAAIVVEVGFSILLILGLGTRLATLPLAFTMIVALFIVHGADPWKVKELSAVFLCGFIGLCFTGPGNFSLDYLIANRNSDRLGDF